MYAYAPLKKKFFEITRTPLPLKSKSNRLVGIYYNQSPDIIDDSLPFYMFRKNADFHYPILYFYPQSKVPDPEFLSRFDVIAKPLADTWFCSKIAYSHFITSKLFFSMLHETVPKAEFYLIFQSDSFLIQSGLETYMQCPFDYYGAVWEKGLIPEALWAPAEPADVVKDVNLHPLLKTVRVGNGGFTLRRIAACETVSEKFRIDQLSYQQEDVFYCILGQLTGMRLAPIDLARRFAWEDPVALGHYIGELKLKTPLGFHNLMADMAELLIQNSLK